jgi:hypothetical protein
MKENDPRRPAGDRSAVATLKGGVSSPAIVGSPLPLHADDAGVADYFLTGFQRIA